MFRVIVFFCLAIGWLPGFANADGLPSPQGDVVLRVIGEVPKSNSGNEAHFDLQMLRDLPSASFSTTTIWTTGEQEFTGVWLGTLLDYVGVQSGSLEASALNEYLIEIPLSDAMDARALIAYEMNGKPMSVRDKGPLWLVYPYDASPEFRNEVYYARSIWQMDTIEVFP